MQISFYLYQNMQFMKVFISYNSKDKPIVESFGQFLVEQGIDVWFDKWEIKAGESLTDKIGAV